MKRNSLDDSNVLVVMRMYDIFGRKFFSKSLHMNFDILEGIRMHFVSIITSVFMATHINIWLFCWMRTPSSWYSRKSNGCFDTTCNASNQSIVEAFSAPSCGQRTSQSKLLNSIPGLLFVSRCIFFIKYKATKQKKKAIESLLSNCHYYLSWMIWGGCIVIQSIPVRFSTHSIGFNYVFSSCDFLFK